MRRISLGWGLFTSVSDKDYEKVFGYEWRIHSDGSVVRWDGFGNVLMHRQIMNCPDGMEVDHINHDKRDNCRENLRICTHHQNCMNAKGGYGSSKYSGVSLKKRHGKGKFFRPFKHWLVVITFNDRSIYVGCFDVEEDAAAAHDKRVKELFGEYAYLNFPDADLWDGT